MVRLILLVFLLWLFTNLTWDASSYLGMALDQTSYFVGIGVAVLTGFILLRVIDWFSSAARPYRPQVAKVNTNETPFQITSAALLALVKIILVVLAVGACILADHYLHP